MTKNSSNTRVNHPKISRRHFSGGLIGMVFLSVATLMQGSHEEKLVLMTGSSLGTKIMLDRLSKLADILEGDLGYLDTPNNVEKKEGGLRFFIKKDHLNIEVIYLYPLRNVHNSRGVLKVYYVGNDVPIIAYENGAQYFKIMNRISLIEVGDILGKMESGIVL